ncbi:DAK2 domain-containing protein [Natranaerofaba carboxydovora]|uniref:DAK2 domain-containing protein n=1 Tax=Natranaerofaba carboxydovora TaxID=2742683 RepID=UPI001F143BCF|nr:DAK2 domain-containing protein [Natranaerofaba carboxydovora]UMZ73309.1 Dihydroxyacetone kinase family protein [Natranaerofaba carboxydovora]
MAEEKFDGYDLKVMFIEGANLLSHSKSSIDALNVFPVPDGDTGTNMNLTLQAACKELEDEELESLDDIASVIATGSLMGARGNSGVILSQLIRGFTKTFSNRKEFDPYVFSEALINGVNTAYKAVLKPVEGTILTVAKDAAVGSQKYLKNNKNPFLRDMLEYVIECARESLEKTPDKLKALKEAGVVDAGGMGLLVIYKGFLEGLNKRLSNDYSSVKRDNVIGVIDQDKVEPYELQSKEAGHVFSGFKYCTEVLVSGENLDENPLKDKLSSLGDSVLVVGDKNLIKVHIHTDRPGIVLEKCCDVGELSNVKIDNMKNQHKEFINKDNTEQTVKEETEDITEDIEDINEDLIKLIVVANGDGLKEIFESMGASEVIAGGQSMNPSTKDILDAVEKAKGNKIILLPNNKNIIMTCEQVVDLTDKEVEVVKTKTIPQGISALIDFDPYAENIHDEKNKMQDNAKDVISGEVTYAVRETKVDEIFVKEGDIIGILEGQIVSSGSDVEEVAFNTLNIAVEDDDIEIISIFTGEDTLRESSMALKDKLEENFADQEIEMYHGGQPLYYYIFSVE